MVLHVLVERVAADIGKPTALSLRDRLQRVSRLCGHAHSEVRGAFPSASHRGPATMSSDRLLGDLLGELFGEPPAVRGAHLL